MITNGAGRVAEVGARFTLDAMPGKQMAIDADLNAGLITEEEARGRRREVAAEADFYGAMDGASKFVKGDAIAGIVITVINLFGGFVVGVVQNGMSIRRGGHDLLACSPSATAWSRRSRPCSSRSPPASSSPGRRPMATWAPTCSASSASTPMRSGSAPAASPSWPWCPASRRSRSSSSAAPALDRRRPQRARAELIERLERGADEPPEQRRSTRTEELLDEMRVEPLELEIAFGLMDLVDPARGGDLLDRVKSLRRKMALELGIVMPPVRTRDNIDLPPARVRHPGPRGRGGPGRGARPVHVLVLGERPADVPGTDTVDPVFGHDGLVGARRVRPPGRAVGATVVDRASVVTAHLAEVVRSQRRRPAQPPGRQGAVRDRPPVRPGGGRGSPGRRHHAGRGAVGAGAPARRAGRRSGTSSASSRS